MTDFLVRWGKGGSKKLENPSNGMGGVIPLCELCPSMFQVTNIEKKGNR